MAYVNVYPSGFALIGQMAVHGCYDMSQGATDVDRGDVLYEVDGYADSGSSAFSNATLGVAAHDYDNSGGSDGDHTMKIIPFLSHLIWVAPIGNAALITRDAIGHVVDLHNDRTLDLADEAVEGYGFKIHSMDVSTEAVAANTYGYAIGHVIGSPST